MISGKQHLGVPVEHCELCDRPVECLIEYQVETGIELSRMIEKRLWLCKPCTDDMRYELSRHAEEYGNSRIMPI